MAKFTVGDRVRVVKHYEGHIPFAPRLMGREGTVEAVQADLPYPYKVSFGLEAVDFAAGELAPLVPPAEDAWASEKVKQVTKVQPVAPVPVWP